MRNYFRKIFSTHSLNFKLNISILMCVLICFFGLVTFISKRSSPIIEAQIEDVARRSIDTYATNIERFISNIIQLVVNAGNNLHQISDKNETNIQLVLNSAVKTVQDSELNVLETLVYVFYDDNVKQGNLYIGRYDENGEIHVNENRIKDFYDKYPWFHEVPKEEKIFWSEPYVDKDSGRSVITCILPFKFKGENILNGIIGLTIDISSVQKSLSEFSFYEAGKLLLISRSGLYIVHPDPNIVLKMTIFELANKMNSSELRNAGYDVLEGNKGKVVNPKSSVFEGDVVFFYVPVKNVGWGLYLVYDKEKFFAPLKEFQLIVFLGMLLGIILLLIVINRICKNSTDQLIALSKLATQYSNGDFSKKFNEIPTSTDIDILLKALTNMRTNLIEYTNKEIQNASDKQKIQNEMDIALNIQKTSLAIKYPEHEAFKISALMTPAKDVSGDFYDFFFVEKNKFAFVIADVSGKGMPAALFMMKSQTLINNITKSNKPLQEVMYIVNNELYERNENCMFVTAFVGVIDLLTGELRYVNAGHLPPMVGDSSGYHFISPKKNIILGVKKDAHFEEESITLSKGEHIFLYTDGVTEAENESSKFYGFDRLQHVFEKVKDSPEDNLKKVLKDVKKFVRNNAQSDDITMLELFYSGYKAEKMTIKADIKRLREVIEFLKKDMDRYGISKDSQFKMIIAAEEAFDNISAYAYADTDENDDDMVDIQTYTKNNTYYVKFLDKGKKYNPLKHKDPDVSVDLKQRAIGGLGIFLEKKLSDELDYVYQDGYNILTMGIHLS